MISLICLLLGDNSIFILFAYHWPVNWRKFPVRQWRYQKFGYQNRPMKEVSLRKDFLKGRASRKVSSGVLWNIEYAWEVRKRRLQFSTEWFFESLLSFWKLLKVPACPKNVVWLMSQTIIMHLEKQTIIRYYHNKCHQYNLKTSHPNFKRWFHLKFGEVLLYDTFTTSYKIQKWKSSQIVVSINQSIQSQRISVMPVLSYLHILKITFMFYM